tara:strand:+ start:114 stop:518 length:405 start_codon:yes stop_codon:yes gene_type:complete
MEKNSTPELLFYQKIGELFYAIAASDKIVRKSEYETLTTMVEEEWKSLDAYKDKFGTDAAYQIAIVFEWFDYEQIDAQDCYNDFEEYYKEHKKLFYDKRKELILRTAQKIADAFSGTNKSELIMLSKLELLFKN